MNATLIKLLLPATLAVAFAAPAIAADAAKSSPAAKSATHQTMKIKRERAEANLKQTAESEGRRADHNRINNDAGVPPSGVPSETMTA